MAQTSFAFLHHFVSETVTMGDISGFVERSEAEGTPCPIHPPVWQRLHKSAVDWPNRLALAVSHQPATLYGIAKASSNNRYLRWSYNDLSLGVNILAGNLQKLGVKRGQPLATFLYNGAEFVMAFCVHSYRRILEVLSTLRRLPTCFGWLEFQLC